MSKALGMIETRGLIASIEAADAMVKAADVSLVNQEKVDAALVTILVEGDVSAVQAAVEAGKVAAERVGTLISAYVIPHPDSGTRDLIKKKEEKAAVAEAKEAPASQKQVDEEEQSTVSEETKQEKKETAKTSAPKKKKTTNTKSDKS
ncbi:BMC domain-containing protein [Bacillus piscicola]|uniref:BMC domain-containing protein n=1 Tax=Bacillus piscicola TaxID=1632684 RepID=UPI001F09DE52